MPGRMMKRPTRYMTRNNGAQPIGGAIPDVQNRFKVAQLAAQRAEFPIIAANIYAPPSVLQLPMEQTDAGNGQVDRIYQPAENPATPVAKARTFGDKLGNWFTSGKFS